MEKKRRFDFFDPFRLLRAEHGTLDSAFAPTVDMFETDNEVIITAQLPGVKKEDVKLRVTENAVSIAISRKEQKEREHEAEGRYEYFKSAESSSWSRLLSLPTPVMPEKAQAQFKNNVLEVRAPINKAKAGREVRIR